MCECGCNEFSPRKILKIGNQILAIEIYPGCEDCGTGIILSIYLLDLDKDAAQNMCIDTEEPIEEFRTDQFGYSQIDIPLLSGDDLAEASKDLADTFDYYDTHEDFIRGNGIALLQRAMQIREETKWA